MARSYPIQMPPKPTLRNNNQKNNKTKSFMQASSSSAPLARNVVTRNSQPRITSLGDGKILVTHSERISSVTGSIAFDVNGFEINPGLLLTFPWLRNIALDYEFYQFRNLKFRYVPRANETIDGNITMAVDFDASDASPQSDEQISAYHHSVSFPPRKEATLICSPGDLKGLFARHKNRFGPLDANQDITTYDVGNLWIATNDFVGATLAGYIWADYSVEFITPQLPDPDDLADSFYLVSASTDRANPFTSASTELGNLASIVDGDDLIVNASGDFLFTWKLVGGTVADTAPTISCGSAVVTDAGSAALAAANGQRGYAVLVGVQKEDILSVDATASCASITAFVCFLTRINY